MELWCAAKASFRARGRGSVRTFLLVRGFRSGRRSGARSTAVRQPAGGYQQAGHEHTPAVRQPRALLVDDVPGGSVRQLPASSSWCSLTSSRQRCRGRAAPRSARGQPTLGCPQCAGVVRGSVDLVASSPVVGGPSACCRSSPGGLTSMNPKSRSITWSAWVE